MLSDQSSKISNYVPNYLKPLRNSGTLFTTSLEIKRMETKTNSKLETIEKAVTIPETPNTIVIERNDDINIETASLEIDTKTSKE